ncbi:helix-turn-helix domain-containing protein [Catenuloplanes japonicus]|uniref:helix-turn-helix domain-containing protein n=1 Tax=Catenuloplanes japonicus TaxID=33876 RepID=UPI000527F691|nr:helix-turn-helix transcriptional regulator [Catenuloplanes japonicus]
MNSETNRADVRDFLAGRRARLTPADVGLPTAGRRRVPGLRREEVATLAGVSTEWYTRLEKGHITGISTEVLDGVARALRLGHEEREYLNELARAARPGPARSRRPAVALEPRVQWMLDAMTLAPAFVTNGRWDVLASNALARALYAPLLDSDVARGAQDINVARYHFLDPGARGFFADWDYTTATVVALLRTEAGRYPHDRDLRELVDELSAASPEFRTRWAAHDVLIANSGRKTFCHPAAGPIALSYYTVELPVTAGDGPLMTVYSAEPGSVAEQRLRSLTARVGP